MVIVSKALPCIQQLIAEGISPKDITDSTPQGVNPLQIIVVNLMPMKEETEKDILRLLATCAQWVRVTFLTMATHTSKHCTQAHLDAHYLQFNQIASHTWDGMIITGAPVEHLPFEEVTYWKELCDIMDWARPHVRSTMYICWGAQAGLYHRYGIQKHAFQPKKFGIFEHRISSSKRPQILNGWDDCCYIPHSRYTEVLQNEIEAVDTLEIPVISDEAGVYMVTEKNGNDIFLTGHAEYNKYTLHNEYQRDLAKGLHIDIPKNYYTHDNPEKEPVMRWKSCANLLFHNWLKYYVSL